MGILTKEDEARIRFQWRLKRMMQDTAAMRRELLTRAQAEIRAKAIQRGVQLGAKNVRGHTLRTLRGEVKALATGDATTGAFVGYASTYDIDRDMEQFAQGCWAESIAAAQARSGMMNAYPFTLLLQHDPNRPVGGFTASEDSKGLLIQGIVDRTTPDGAVAWSGMTNGYLTGLSVGFISGAKSYKGNVTIITKADLMETSLVSVPANPAARVTSIN